MGQNYEEIGYVWQGYVKFGPDQMVNVGPYRYDQTVLLRVVREKEKHADFGGGGRRLHRLADG